MHTHTYVHTGKHIRCTVCCLFIVVACADCCGLCAAVGLQWRDLSLVLSVAYSVLLLLIYINQFLQKYEDRIPLFFHQQMNYRIFSNPALSRHQDGGGFASKFAQICIDVLYDSS